MNAQSVLASNGELQAENERLRRSVYELSVLNELAREIGASQNSQEVMQTVISRSLRAVNAEQGVITLSPRLKDGEPTTLVRSMASTGEGKPYIVDMALLGWMQLNKTPLLIFEPQKDSRFRGVVWNENIKSLVCVPLLIKSELTGILTVFNKRGGEVFTDEDVRLLAILASQSAQVVENARLHEEEHNFIRLQEELRLAADIQSSLLPKTHPEIEGYDIKGYSLPAHSIGGDYFDFIRRDDQHLAICLGDVVGKGITAAMVMSNMQATIRGQARPDSSPAACLTLANTLLYHSTSANKFATLFYGQLHVHSHEFYYANAGHNRPMLFPSTGEVVELQTAGLPLSVIEHETFQEDHIAIQRGDVLVIFSDGITEAMTRDDHEFGEERLRNAIQKHIQDSAQDIIQAIIAAINDFVGDAKQTDDMTLVVLKRL